MYCCNVLGGDGGGGGRGWGGVGGGKVNQGGICCPPPVNEKFHEMGFFILAGSICIL